MYCLNFITFAITYFVWIKMKDLQVIRRVILADDDEDDREVFKEVLNDIDKDIPVVLVNDGPELMSYLNGIDFPQPLILFLDLNMPRKNGFECLKEIRANEKLKHIPVVIFSTSNDPRSIATTYSLEANLYVHKPATYQQLKKVIKNILGIDFMHTGHRYPIDEYEVKVN